MNIFLYTDRFFLLNGYNNVGTVHCTYHVVMRYDDTPFSHTQAEYAKAIEFHILQYLIWDSQFAYDLVVFRSLESVFDKSRVTNVRSRSRYGTLFT